MLLYFRDILLLIILSAGSVCRVSVQCIQSVADTVVGFTGVFRAKTDFEQDVEIDVG